jgi:hypothetical protein
MSNGILASQFLIVYWERAFLLPRSSEPSDQLVDPGA